ncbi:MAG: ABC transporter substrate-binding protein [Deltaproteobacteria bacterium]|nr:ABC transporter substrate-binding protein [Deltaproteobacteria bacterium]
MAVFTLTYTSSLWGGTYPSIAYSTFREGGIWWPNMVAIHKNTPRPNAAKLFVNYLVSEEGQRIFAAGHAGQGAGRKRRRVEGAHPENLPVEPVRQG